MLLDEYVIVCDVTGKYVQDKYSTWDDQTKKLSQAVIFESEQAGRDYMLWHFMIEPAYRLEKL